MIFDRKNIYSLALVSFFIMMVPSCFLANNDSLLTSLVGEIESKKNDRPYIDSLMVTVYNKYNNLNPELLGKLSNYLEMVSNNSGYKLLMPWSRYFNGYYHYYLEDYTEALYKLEESLSLFRETKNNLMIAFTYNMLGLTYYKNTNYNIAIDYFTKSIKILEKDNNSYLQFKGLANIGIIYLEIDPTKSIEYLLSSLKMLDNDKDELNKLQIYIALTNAYIKLNDYKTAQSYLSISEDLNSRTNNVSSESRILLYKALIYQNNGDFFNALKIYQFLLENASKYRKFHTKVIIVVNQKIAEIKYLQNDFKESIYHYFKAIDEAKAQKYDNVDTKLYEGISRSFSKLNQIDSAIKYYNLFVDSKAKTINSKTDEETQKILYNYELNKKELEIQKVIIESRNSENQIKNFVIIGSIMIIIILLIFIIFYYKSYKRNFELSEKLHSEIKSNDLMNKALLEAKIKVEESDNFKSAIIRNMTHEIRTPFNGLLGFVSLMKKRSAELDDEELNEYSELVELSGKRVYELVSNLNDLALLESNDYQLHFGLSYLPDIINEVYFQFINQASNKGLVINLGNIDDIIFESDSGALSKALKNVVDNAVKFTSIGHIRIWTNFVKEALEIIVEDTGIGISEEHISNIGLPFKQVDMSISRSYEGMGVGLAVTKKIVQKLNGEMTVTSKSENGTKVVFTLNQVKIKNEILLDDFMENN